MCVCAHALTVLCTSLSTAITKCIHNCYIHHTNSVATCLGARRVSKRSFEWTSQHKILSRVISDKQALAACVRSADDLRILVPPACGATMAAVYEDTIIKDAQQSGQLPEKLNNIVVIVCGGNGVNLDKIQKWRKECGL